MPSIDGRLENYPSPPSYHQDCSYYYESSVSSQTRAIHPGAVVIPIMTYNPNSSSPHYHLNRTIQTRLPSYPQMLIHPTFGEFSRLQDDDWNDVNQNDASDGSIFMLNRREGVQSGPDGPLPESEHQTSEHQSSEHSEHQKSEKCEHREPSNQTTIDSSEQKLMTLANESLVETIVGSIVHSIDSTVTQLSGNDNRNWRSLFPPRPPNNKINELISLVEKNRQRSNPSSPNSGSPNSGSPNSTNPNSADPKKSPTDNKSSPKCRSRISSVPDPHDDGSFPSLDEPSRRSSDSSVLQTEVSNDDYRDLSKKESEVRHESKIDNLMHGSSVREHSNESSLSSTSSVKFGETERSKTVVAVIEPRCKGEPIILSHLYPVVRHFTVIFLTMILTGRCEQLVL